MIQPSPQQILTWVRKYFPEARLHSQDTQVAINNPFRDDTGRNLWISLTQGVCHDWRGDAAWAKINPRTGKRKCSFLSFVQQYLKCSWHTAVKSVLGAQASLAFATEHKQESAQPQKAIDLPEGTQPLLDSTSKLASRIVRNWLASRGVTDEDIGRYDIRHVGTTVVFPYYEWDELVYWQSRAVTSKTFNFPTKEGQAAGKSDFLYGFDQVEPASYLVITESIFCAITLAEQTVATGGAKLGSGQLRKIKALGPREGIVLAPDNDAAGIESIMTNRELLAGLGYPLFFSLPGKMEMPGGRLTKDWNEFVEHLRMPRMEVRTRFEKGISALDTMGVVRLLAQI